MWGNAVENVGGFQPTGGVSDVYDIRWCFLDDVSSWVLAGCLPSSWIFSEIILVLVLVNPTDKCWDVVNCAGTDGRRGLDEVGVP